MTGRAGAAPGRASRGSTDRYDVVVVGAGLAGLECARGLARRSLSVLLVDARGSIDRPVHTTGIFVRRTLEDFGLPDDLLGRPIRHVTLYSPARRPLALASGRDEFRIGRMGRLYLHMLESARAAGVEWAPGTRYAGCEAADGGDESLLRLEVDGRSRWVRTRFVVGSDGARSLVAQDLGLDVNREWIVGVEEVFRRAPLSGPPALHCFLDPAIAPGYMAWVAGDGDETHVGVGGYPGRFSPLAALEKFRGSLSDLVDMSVAERVERRGGRVPVGGVLTRIASARGLLVGDAAGAVSPLTAGGFDACLRLSAFAARIVAEGLATGDRAALAGYHGSRFRARFVSRRWMRRILASVRSRAAVELACAALRRPPLRSVVEQVFFGRGSFPELGPAPALGQPSP